MRFDPTIYSPAAIAEYREAQRRYARVGVAGLIAGVLATIVFQLGVLWLALLLLVIGGVVVFTLAVVSYREIHRAYIRRLGQRSDWLSEHPSPPGPDRLPH
jgi:hypothetical protein